MPSKLKKAIGAVKDQTSISLAKVSNNNSANVEVTVLKATSHDVVPIEDKYIQEILTLISSNKSHAASSAQAIAKRIGKTRNWIVVLKSLMLVLRVFQDGDPYFPIEVLHSMKRGAKILNLSNFRDDSHSCPWDYTAFVRTFALYLDERLDCFLTGKLQRRFTYQRAHDNNNNRGSRRSNEPVVRDMKPAMLLDRIHYWQKLLDRAIATTPTGAAKTNRLVLISLYAIVQETYDLYRDISDGLALLLDSFFQLQYQSCVNAFHACVKASKQFEELSSFYGFCKSLGVGRTSEYPSVQKISEELLETLQEFLKDQASFPGRSPPTHLQVGGDQTGTKDKDKGLNMSTNQNELASSEQFETASERESAFGSACASLEDLMSVTDQNGNVSPSWSVEQEFYNSEDQPDKPVEDEIYGSNQSLPTLDQPQPPSFDLVTFEEWPPQPDNNQIPAKGVEEILGVDVHQEGTKEGWELVLFESANNQPPIQTSPFGSVNNMFEYSSNLENLFPQSSMPQHQYNPFLQDTIQIECFATSSNASTTSSNGMGNFGDADLFSFPSSHQQVAPTFCAESTNDTTISSTFSAQSLKDGPMAPTYFAINSNEIRAPPTFSLQNADHTTMAPTFSAHNTSNNTMAPTFCKQSPKGSTMSPTLWSQTTNESTVSPTLCAHNTKYNTMASTFCARNVNETTTSTICAQTPYGISISPTFCAWSTSDTTITKAPTVCGQSPKDNTMAPPTFCARDTNETTMTPTFCAPNHNDSQKIPTCSSSTRDNEIVAPTFRAENCNDIILAQTFRADNRNDAYLAPTFRVDNRNDTTLTPTFHAESRNDRFMTFHADNRNDMIVAPIFRADEPSEFTTAPTFCAGSQNETIGTLPYVENDPFASFSNVTTSELMCNGLVNQESLLHQQRLWLEQQNKIIAKHRG